MRTSANVHDSVAVDQLDADVIAATREVRRQFLQARVRVLEWDLPAARVRTAA